MRKLFDKNVASGTSIFSINARVKKKISIPITRASFEKKKLSPRIVVDIIIKKKCRIRNFAQSE